MGIRLYIGFTISLLTSLVVAPHLPAAPPALPADHAERMLRSQDLFTKHIRKLFLDACLKCHGGDKVRSGLDLSRRETLLKGGDNGPAVVLGQGKASRLYKLIAHLEDPHMPAKEPRLADDQVARVAAWIDLGAAYDKPLVEQKTVRKPLVVSDEDRRFWSFQPLQRPALPEVKNKSWGRNAIDVFLLARLEEKGLNPSAAVERRRLIRRAYFDLIGLPPTPPEVEAFVADPAPDAYERLIDRLLENPHYGERWARHWLDIVRYAESHGFEHDYDRPTAYPYRDFVIKALNQDLPYNTFVKWQIAGDELVPDNPLALTATGFLAAGVHSTQITNNQVEKERYDELDDIVRTLGTSMLGLTIGCARCHDHKFDPIPTRDYYRLLSTFTTTVRTEVDIPLDQAAYADGRSRFEAEHAPLRAALVRYEKEQLPGKLDQWLARRGQKREGSGPPMPVQLILARLSDKPEEKLSAEERGVLVRWYRTTDPEWRKLNQRVEEHQRKAPSSTASKALICSEGLPPVRLHSQGADFLKETHFLKRGDPNQKDGVAEQSFLQVLTRTPEQEKHWQTPPPSGWRTSYRRKALADWVTDVDYGAGQLLARVIVNRLWQHHMGRGIVGTPGDFGFQGERPTHPELLDWLAGELIARGWSLKAIHKLILTSSAYRQETAGDRDKARVDPENRLYWRRTPRRLQGEVIRDSMLAVGGLLDDRMFGPGTLDPNHKRRSIYFFVKRSQLPTMMTLFDGPDTLQGMEARAVTTIAPQALLLMNNKLVRDCAEGLARRVTPAEGKDVAGPVQQAYLAALARRPTEEERKDAVAFVKEQQDSYQADGRKDAQHLALTDFCQVLLELNEFVYVD